MRIQNFDRTKSRAIQPIWAGPFYVVEDNDSHVKVSKNPFGQPLKTLLHKNLIKPYHFRNIPKQPEPMAITDIDSNERHLFQNSEYVQKQGQGNQTNKQSVHKVKLIKHQRFTIRMKLIPKTQRPSLMRQEKVYQMNQEKLTMVKVNLKQRTQKFMKTENKY